MSIYSTIGLPRVINAAGRMTALGVSTLSDEVAKAVVEGGQSYVVLDELMDKAGEIISSYTKAEASVVTSSASAGICMSVAGVISKGKKSILERLPDSSGLANEILLMKGHVVQFGAPVTTLIRLGGGIPIEVGMANDVCETDVEEAINENTAALLYIKSHHCIQKGMLSLEKMIEIAHAHNLPLIVDAAAEEDMCKYVAMGADMVIYSGAKALEATSSGFITGKKQYINYARKQYNGIARPMKIGKEGIMGLLKAMELYFKKDHDAEVKLNLESVAYLNDAINQIKGLKAVQVQDEAGREIYRSQVSVDEAVTHKSALEIDAELRSGNPAIHCRKHLLSLGILSFDTRPLGKGDKEIIAQRLKEIVEGKHVKD